MGQKERIATLGKRAPDGAWEIPILGDIGFFGTNGEDLIRELNAVRPAEVRFLIYSPGGAVYDAIAVVGYMLDKGIKSYTEIYGLCASAATVFAAHSGPKNTAIAPGSLFLVHMPFNGDQKALDNATAFLIDLYMKSYGWTKAEAKQYMEFDNGEGELWTAAEAKKFGVVSEIMEGAKVAAHVKQRINPPAMAEKVKNTVPVKLTFGKAITAAFGGEVTAEVDLEQEVADQLKEKDDTIAELQAQIKVLAEAKVEVPDVPEVIEDAAEVKAKAEAEEVKAKAAEKLATDAHTKALADLKAAHAAEIAALRKPLDKPTVANNAEVKHTADAPTPSESAAKTFASKNVNALAAGLNAKADKK